jgi:hypothetical protein
MTDTAVAVAAIEAERDGAGSRVTVAPSIQDSVVAALQSRHPAQFRRSGPHILCRLIAPAPDRYRSDDDAINP